MNTPIPLWEQLIALAEYWCEDVPLNQSSYELLEITEANSLILKIRVSENGHYNNHKAMCYRCLLEAEFQKDAAESEEVLKFIYGT